MIVEKAFAKKLPWAWWTYSFAKKRKVCGPYVVVLLWCSHDGRWRIPVAFRLWRPKRSVGAHDFRAKLQLAETMVKDVLAAGSRCDYVVFDTRYTAGWFTKLLGRSSLTRARTVGPRTHVLWRGEKLPVGELAWHPRFKWRSHLGIQTVPLRVCAPTFGLPRLAVTRNRQGSCECLASNDLHADLTTIVRR